MKSQEKTLVCPSAFSKNPILRYELLSRYKNTI